MCPSGPTTGSTISCKVIGQVIGTDILHHHGQAVVVHFFSGFNRMFSHLVTFLGVVTTFAVSASHSPFVGPSITPSIFPEAVPTSPCVTDTTSEIVLGSILGASLAGMAATIIIRRNIHDCYRIFGHNGDSERVYDTPCAYCGKKQPADCMREHLSECLEHLDHWVPKSQRYSLKV